MAYAIVKFCPNIKYRKLLNRLWDFHKNYQNDLAIWKIFMPNYTRKENIPDWPLVVVQICV